MLGLVCQHSETKEIIRLRYELSSLTHSQLTAFTRNFMRTLATRRYRETGSPYLSPWQRVILARSSLLSSVDEVQDCKQCSMLLTHLNAMLYPN